MLGFLPLAPPSTPAAAGLTLLEPLATASYGGVSKRGGLCPRGTPLLVVYTPAGAVPAETATQLQALGWEPLRAGWILPLRDPPAACS